MVRLTLALVFALVLAVPLGVLAAVRKNTWIDRAVLMLSVFGQAIPGFWLGLLLIYLFGVILRWLPISARRVSCRATPTRRGCAL